MNLRLSQNPESEGCTKDAADDVLNYPRKQEEKHAQEQEERRKRFDELIKGR